MSCLRHPPENTGKGERGVKAKDPGEITEEATGLFKGRDPFVEAMWSRHKVYRQ